MPPTKPNVVIDANVLVSALLRSGSIPDQAVIAALQTCRVCVSAKVLAEIAEVSARPRLRSRIRAARVEQLLALLEQEARHLMPAVRVTDCRDPKDNKYLELALAAEAFAIVTGDTDLFALDPWRGIRIVTPADFLAMTSATGMER